MVCSYEPAMGSNALAHLRRGELVIRDLVDPVLQVVRTAIAEIEIVAVLPHIDAEQGLAFAGGDGVGAVRGLGDFQLAVIAEHQPGPARAELRRAGLLERVLELLNAAEILLQLRFKLAGNAAAVRAHALPEQD